MDKDNEINFKKSHIKIVIAHVIMGALFIGVKIEDIAKIHKDVMDFYLSGLFDINKNFKR